MCIISKRKLIMLLQHNCAAKTTDVGVRWQYTMRKIRNFERVLNGPEKTEKCNQGVGKTIVMAGARTLIPWLSINLSPSLYIFPSCTRPPRVRVLYTCNRIKRSRIEHTRAIHTGKHAATTRWTVKIFHYYFRLGKETMYINCVCAAPSIYVCTTRGWSVRVIIIIVIICDGGGSSFSLFNNACPRII